MHLLSSLVLLLSQPTPLRRLDYIRTLNVITLLHEVLEITMIEGIAILDMIGAPSRENVMPDMPDVHTRENMTPDMAVVHTREIVSLVIVDTHEIATADVVAPENVIIIKRIRIRHRGETAVIHEIDTIPHDD